MGIASVAEGGEGGMGITSVAGGGGGREGGREGDLLNEGTLNEASTHTMAPHTQTETHKIGRAHV